MFATIRNAPRRQVNPSMVEALDARTLMSVTVPTGYVQVDHLTLDAYTLAPQTFAVTGGSDYFFKATGKHVLAQNPTRYADAGSWQPNTTSWNNGTHLHVRNGTTDLVNWGAHADDNEYGASLSPTANLTLTAVITDSYRFDNQGVLELYIYERVDGEGLQGGGPDEYAAARAASRSVFNSEATSIGGDLYSATQDVLEF